MKPSYSTISLAWQVCIFAMSDVDLVASELISQNVLIECFRKPSYPQNCKLIVDYY